MAVTSIYLSISLSNQSYEIPQSALSVNGNIYFYWSYGGGNSQSELKGVLTKNQVVYTIHNGKRTDFLPQNQLYSHAYIFVT